MNQKFNQEKEISMNQQKRPGKNSGKEDSQAIHKFVLGTKELEGKTAEFQYDRGWYLITDIIGEERVSVFKSKNAPEAYLKWNVYIGRKKERVAAENRRKQKEEQREMAPAKNSRPDNREVPENPSRTANTRPRNGKKPQAQNGNPAKSSS